MQEKGPVQRSLNEGGFAHLILIFVVLVILVIAGYFAYQKFYVSPASVAPVKQTVDTPPLQKPAAPAATATATADSSTYTNPFSSESAEASDSEYLNPFENLQ